MPPLRIPSEDEVLAQGFAFKPSWWRRYVEPPWWPEALDRLPEVLGRPGYRRITRRDVFALSVDRTPEGRVGLLLGAYIWGTGESAFLVGRRVRTFTRTPIEAVGKRLVTAADLMHTAGPIAAYESLLSRQANHVKFMGPAFFTKYLYYAGGLQPTTRPQPLILDKFVARALDANFGGWALRGNGWSGATYGRYLRLAAEMAEQEGSPATPAGVEFALFKARP